MTSAHKEATFETEMAEYLAHQGWLYSPDDTGYDKVRAIFPADIRGWLEDTQRETFEKVVRPADPPAKQGKDFERLLDTITGVLDTPLDNGGGTLAVLRTSVKHVSAKFEMCQAKPADTMNPATLDRYAKVRLRVMRQVHYSVARPNRSIDLVLFVNGIPVATIEIKTDFTQSVAQGEVQYAQSRQPTDPGKDRNEPLLTFGARALVHFVLTNNVVSMTTKLAGDKTVFLPFNKGYQDKAGNPPDLTGSDTAYFWRDILDRDTWLTIVTKYMMVKKERKTDPVTGKPKTSVSIRYPRFHQLQAVEKLVAAAREEGAGSRYLIEHSAGSGKTDTIAWTAHRLAALHDADNNKVFDSVIVVTDRTVLDYQMAQAMFQIEHKRSQVVSVGDEDSPHAAKSTQLVEALTSRTPIVVVTIQTFPFALEAIRRSKALVGRNFAVIADEAHSSQTGQTAAKLRDVLSPEEFDALADGGEVDTEAILAAEMTQRAAAKNISYLAFTATPKGKTMELFGRPDAHGKPQSFHRYSMSQAIDEGFILDVLKNYTPYKVAFKLVHDGQDYDSEKVDKSRALQSLMQWVRLHPYNISQKVKIIVEHYRVNIAHLLDGHAKAMVVTSSRKEAVRYQKALEAYITEKGYGLKALVAFSGTVEDPETAPEPVTETTMNPGLRGRKVADAFNGPEYQVLIVANKYQVGFDQPLLCAMYVDKRLSGVMAVQTLSRLNRTHPGKDKVYVLDFVNNPDEILASFEPYYRGASLLESTDPNLVHQVATKLDQSGMYTDEEIEAAAVATIAQGSNDALASAVSPARHRFQDAWRDAQLDEDTEELDRLEMFRSDLNSYVKAYEFLSQIVDYADTDLEKRAIFYRALAQTIRVEARFVGVDLSAVVMTHHRISTDGAATIELEKSETTPLNPLTALGGGQLRESDGAGWEEILDHINTIFAGTDLAEEDRIAAIEHTLLKSKRNDDLVEKAKHNTDSDFYGADDEVLGSFLDSALEAQKSYGEAMEVLFKDASRDSLMAILKRIQYRRWLTDELKKTA
ncbi:type I restriction endonuclease subunit R [Georgenia subflava]|uniref:Type I restriction endonuclease subunit R n=1 Tax=Georgenia subflava TaxID=1622177 RepID=A0A6N7EJ07_9MICO|nr:DEAD/DEAH box helicase family protein [Georgenia subflava]MPV36717.1 type I restriction endonuclease subunit R [Georgenia subflava]